MSRELEFLNDLLKGDLVACKKYVLAGVSVNIVVAQDILYDLGANESIKLVDTYVLPVFDKLWLSELSPLMAAILSGATDVVKYVIENGATVNFANKYGLTALHCIALLARRNEGAAIELLDILLELGANPLLAINKDYRSESSDYLPADFCVSKKIRPLMLNAEMNSIIINSMDDSTLSVDNVLKKGCEIDAFIRQIDEEVDIATQERQALTDSLINELDALKVAREEIDFNNQELLATLMLMQDILLSGFAKHRDMTPIESLCAALLQLAYGEYAIYNLNGMHNHEYPASWDIDEKINSIFQLADLQVNAEIDDSSLDAIVQVINEKYLLPDNNIQVTLNINNQLCISKNSGKREKNIYVVALAGNFLLQLPVAMCMSPRVHKLMLIKSIFTHDGNMNELCKFRAESYLCKDLDSCSTAELCGLMPIEKDAISNFKTYKDFYNLLLHSIESTKLPLEANKQLKFAVDLLRKIATFEVKDREPFSVSVDDFDKFRYLYIKSLLAFMTQKCIDRKEELERQLNNGALSQIEAKINSVKSDIKNVKDKLQSIEQKQSENKDEIADIAAKITQLKEKQRVDLNTCNAEIESLLANLGTAEKKLQQARHKLEKSDNAAVKAAAAKKILIHEELIVKINEQIKVCELKREEMIFQVRDLEVAKVKLETEAERLSIEKQGSEDFKARSESTLKTLEVVLAFLQRTQDAIVQHKELFIERKTRQEIIKKCMDAKHVQSNGFKQLYEFLLSLNLDLKSAEIESSFADLGIYYLDFIATIEEVFSLPKLSFNDGVLRIESFNICWDDVLDVVAAYVEKTLLTYNLKIADGFLAIDNVAPRISDLPHGLRRRLEQYVMHRDLPDVGKTPSSTPSWAAFNTVKEPEIIDIINGAKLDYAEILTALFNTIEVVAGNDIFIAAPKLEFQGINLILFAKNNIELAENTVINTSGRDALQYANKKANSGNKYSRHVSIPNGNDGADGLHGMPGYNAGHVTIHAGSTISNLQTLSAFGLGGKGGDGQIGGDGEEGRVGSETPPANPDDCPPDLRAWYNYASFTDPNTHYMRVAEARIPGIGRGGEARPEEKSGNGGDAGRSGRYGKGGRAGEIRIEDAANSVLINANDCEFIGSNLGEQTKARFQVAIGTVGDSAELSAVGGAAGKPGLKGYPAYKMKWKSTFWFFFIPIVSWKYKHEQGNYDIKQFFKDLENVTIDSPYSFWGWNYGNSYGHAYSARNNLTEESWGGYWSRQYSFKSNVELSYAYNNEQRMTNHALSIGDKGKDQNEIGYADESDAQLPIENKNVYHEPQSLLTLQKSADKLAKLHAVEKSKEKTQEEISDLKNNIAAMQAKIATLQAGLQEKEEQLNQATQKISAVNAKQQEVDAELSGLDANLQQARANAHAAEMGLLDAVSEGSQLTADVINRQRDAQFSAVDLRSEETVRQKLDQQYSSLQYQANNYRASLESNNGKLAADREALRKIMHDKRQEMDDALNLHNAELNKRSNVSKEIDGIHADLQQMHSKTREKTKELVSTMVEKKYVARSTRMQHGTRVDNVLREEILTLAALNKKIRSMYHEVVTATGVSTKAKKQEKFSEMRIIDILQNALTNVTQNFVANDPEMLEPLARFCDFLQLSSLWFDKQSVTSLSHADLIGFWDAFDSFVSKISPDQNAIACFSESIFLLKHSLLEQSINYILHKSDVVQADLLIKQRQQFNNKWQELFKNLALNTRGDAYLKFKFELEIIKYFISPMRVKDDSKQIMGSAEKDCIRNTEYIKILLPLFGVASNIICYSPRDLSELKKEALSIYNKLKEHYNSIIMVDTKNSMQLSLAILEMLSVANSRLNDRPEELPEGQKPYIKDKFRYKDFLLATLLHASKSITVASLYESLFDNYISVSVACFKGLDQSARPEEIGSMVNNILRISDNLSQHIDSSKVQFVMSYLQKYMALINLQPEDCIDALSNITSTIIGSVSAEDAKVINSIFVDIILNNLSSTASYMHDVAESDESRQKKAAWFNKIVGLAKLDESRFQYLIISEFVKNSVATILNKKGAFQIDKKWLVCKEKITMFLNYLQKYARDFSFANICKLFSVFCVNSIKLFNSKCEPEDVNNFYCDLGGLLESCVTLSKSMVTEDIACEGESKENFYLKFLDYIAANFLAKGKEVKHFLYAFENEISDLNLEEFESKIAGIRKKALFSVDDSSAALLNFLEELDCLIDKSNLLSCYRKIDAIKQDFLSEDENYQKISTEIEKYSDFYSAERDAEITQKNKKKFVRHLLKKLADCDVDFPEQVDIDLLIDQSNKSGIVEVNKLNLFRLDDSLDVVEDIKNKFAAVTAAIAEGVDVNSIFDSWLCLFKEFAANNNLPPKAREVFLQDSRTLLAHVSFTSNKQHAAMHSIASNVNRRVISKIRELNLNSNREAGDLGAIEFYKNVENFTEVVMGSSYKFDFYKNIDVIIRLYEKYNVVNHKYNALQNLKDMVGSDLDKLFLLMRSYGVGDLAPTRTKFVNELLDILKPEDTKKTPSKVLDDFKGKIEVVRSKLISVAPENANLEAVFGIVASIAQVSKVAEPSEDVNLLVMRFYATIINISLEKEDVINLSKRISDAFQGINNHVVKDIIMYIADRLVGFICEEKEEIPVASLRWLITNSTLIDQVDIVKQLLLLVEAKGDISFNSLLGNESTDVADFCRKFFAANIPNSDAALSYEVLKYFNLLMVSSDRILALETIVAHLKGLDFGSVFSAVSNFYLEVLAKLCVILGTTVIGDEYINIRIQAYIVKVQQNINNATLSFAEAKYLLEHLYEKIVSSNENGSYIFNDFIDIAGDSAVCVPYLFTELEMQYLDGFAEFNLEFISAESEENSWLNAIKSNYISKVIGEFFIAHTSRLCEQLFFCEASMGEMVRELMKNISEKFNLNEIKTLKEKTLLRMHSVVVAGRKGIDVRIEDVVNKSCLLKEKITISYSIALADNKEMSWVRFLNELIRNVSKENCSSDYMIKCIDAAMLINDFDVIYNFVSGFRGKDLYNVVIYFFNIVLDKKIPWKENSKIETDILLNEVFKSQSGINLIFNLASSICKTSNDNTANLNVDKINQLLNLIVATKAYNDHIVVSDLADRPLSMWQPVLERRKLALDLRLNATEFKHREILDNMLVIRKKIDTSLFDTLISLTSNVFDSQLSEFDDKQKNDFYDIFTKFADGSWLCDKVSLEIIAAKEASKWNESLSSHFAKMYEDDVRPRDARKIVDLMSAMSINKDLPLLKLELQVYEGRSEKFLVSLVQDVEREYAKAEIASLTKEDIINIANAEFNSKKTGRSFLVSGGKGGGDYAELVRFLVIIKKAFKLVALAQGKDYEIRDSQLVSAIIYILSFDSGKGRFANISTGEGKTLTTQILAIACALRGEIVDVITSSEALAEPNAAEAVELLSYFDLKVSNNCDAKAREDQDVRKNRYANSDVIFGDIGSFQKDYLLTNFMRKKVRPNSSHALIIDEVDSAVIDNASKVLYISHQITDFRHLRSIFLFIWHCVNSSEYKINNESNINAIIAKFRESVANGSLSTPAYENVHTFIDLHINDWIKSAYSAKLMDDNVQYSLMDKEGYGKKSVVINDLSTGVEQLNSRWSNGLHAFLELRYRNDLSCETLKAVYESNVSYIKKYAKSGKLFGMTGTLGGKSELELMSDVYNVDFFKVPRFMRRKYQQEKACVTPATDSMAAWFDEIYLDVNDKLSDKIEVSEADKSNYESVLVSDKASMIDIKSFINSLLENKEKKLNKIRKTEHKIGVINRKVADMMPSGIGAIFDNNKEERDILLRNRSDLESKLLLDKGQLKKIDNDYNDKAQELIEVNKHIVNTESILAGKKGRAVLIICEDKRSAQAIQESLQNRLDGKKASIYPYVSYLDGLQLENSEVQPGDIIIATNIAGRGTDLAISKSCMEAGGLHVILSYVPSNIRIEEQAFGRTARSGQVGSGRFIVADSRSREINDISIEQLRDERDEAEKERLAEIKDKQIPSLDFSQDLFIKYTLLEKEIYDYLISKKYHKDMVLVQLKSLQDSWAFWRDQHNELIENITEDTEHNKDALLQKLESWSADQRGLLHASIFMLVTSPGELMNLAAHYMEEKKYNEAIFCYEKVIAIDSNFAAFAYYYLAQAKINIDSSASVKRSCRTYLKKALALFKEEVSYLNTANQIIRLLDRDRQKTGKGLEVDNYTQRNMDEIGVLTIHINACKLAIGYVIDAKSLEAGHVVESESKALFDNLRDNADDLFKDIRISRKAKLSSADDKSIPVELFYSSAKIKFPSSLNYLKNKILDILSQHVGDEYCKRKISKQTFAAIANLILTKASFHELFSALIIAEDTINIKEGITNKTIKATLAGDAKLGQYSTELASFILTIEMPCTSAVFEQKIKEIVGPELDIATVIGLLDKGGVINSGKRYSLDTKFLDQVSEYKKHILLVAQSDLSQLLDQVPLEYSQVVGYKAKEIKDTLKEIGSSRPIIVSDLKLSITEFAAVFKMIWQTGLLQNNLLKECDIDCKHREYVKVLEESLLILSEKDYFVDQDIDFPDNAVEVVDRLFDYLANQEVIKMPKVNFSQVSDSKSEVSDLLGKIEKRLGSESLTRVIEDSIVSLHRPSSAEQEKINAAYRTIAEQERSNAAYRTIAEQERINAARTMYSDVAARNLIKAEDDRQKNVKALQDSLYEIFKNSIGTLKTFHKVQLDNKDLPEYYSDLKVQKLPPAAFEYILYKFDSVLTLIEKIEKNLSFWDILFAVLLAITQIVVGVLCTIFIPGAGALIGRMLISEGIGDLLFISQSVANGHFSWSDYGSHKLQSLAMSVAGAGFTAITSGFGKNAINFSKTLLKELSEAVISVSSTMVINSLVSGLSQGLTDAVMAAVKAKFANIRVECVDEINKAKEQAARIFNAVGAQQAPAIISAAVKELNVDNLINTLIAPKTLAAAKSIASQISQLNPSAETRSKWYGQIAVLLAKIASWVSEIIRHVALVQALTAISTSSASIIGELASVLARKADRFSDSTAENVDQDTVDQDNIAELVAKLIDGSVDKVVESIRTHVEFVMTDYSSRTINAALSPVVASIKEWANEGIEKFMEKQNAFVEEAPSRVEQMAKSRKSAEEATYEKVGSIVNIDDVQDDAVVKTKDGKVRVSKFTASDENNNAFTVSDGSLYLLESDFINQSSTSYIFANDFAAQKPFYELEPSLDGYKMPTPKFSITIGVDKRGRTFCKDEQSKFTKKSVPFFLRRVVREAGNSFELPKSKDGSFKAAARDLVQSAPMSVSHQLYSSASKVVDGSYVNSSAVAADVSFDLKDKSLNLNAAASYEGGYNLVNIPLALPVMSYGPFSAELELSCSANAFKYSANASAQVSIGKKGINNSAAFGASFAALDGSCKLLANVCYKNDFQRKTCATAELQASGLAGGLGVSAEGKYIFTPEKSRVKFSAQTLVGFGAKLGLALGWENKIDNKPQVTYKSAPQNSKPANSSSSQGIFSQAKEYIDGVNKMFSGASF